MHDAPAGIPFWRYDSNALGLAEVVAATRPHSAFFGHHHARVRTEVAGVPCIGLNAVGRPGHLVALEATADGVELVGEWM